MGDLEIVECPFCFERMHFEDRDGVGWLVCLNGCPTEVEAPSSKDAETLAAIRQRAAGAT